MTTEGWNFAAVWERIAQVVPDEPAVIHGEVGRTWRDFDRRADGVAAGLVAAGLRPGDTFVQYLRNGNEYLESFFAACKLGVAPVNTNYRYLDDELLHVWGDAGAAAVVFDGSFVDRVSRLRWQLPAVRLWLHVDAGAACPSWATPYEALAESGARADAGGARTGDDLILLYTGGTTGLPKGVMWRQDDFYNALSHAMWKDPITSDLDAVAERVSARTRPVHLPACPLMHGTGMANALQALCQGGAVVTVPGRALDVVALLDAIERRRVTCLAIVGDAYGRALVAALSSHRGRWDLRALSVLLSAGAVLSTDTKESLLDELPGIRIVDAFASSEALGMAHAVTSRAGGTTASRFSLGDRAQVLDDDGSPVVPGSGRIGRLAVGGFQPLGYRNDAEKTSRTFVTIDGRRYSVPGDLATVEPDGTITILGRGSTCINTAGEKVFPDEVERVLKVHPAVRDCAVVGVPDIAYGEVVVAVVEPEGDDVDRDDLVAHVKRHLAGYKAPRFVVVAPVDRGPNGKVDHARLRQVAVDAMAGSAHG